MPTYIQESLHKFQHPSPSRPQDAPHAWNQYVYGAAVQYAYQPDTSPLLPPKSINLVQQIIGTLIYYAIVVDPTMIVAISAIASQQSKATQTTRDATVWLLNYSVSHPNATIRYSASEMVLDLYSDASYLSEPGACSHVGGNHFLGNKSTDPTKPPLTDSPLNGPIYNVSKILHNVMVSAAEAEIGVTFHNGEEAMSIRTTSQELGHPQPPTPIRVDNSTAEGFANGTIKQKTSKTIDMRFYWIQDRTRQGQFLISWKPGSTNLSDYFTKNHSPAHRHIMQPTYLHPTTQLANAVIYHILRGCVNPTTRAPRTLSQLNHRIW